MIDVDVIDENVFHVSDHDSNDELARISLINGELRIRIYAEDVRIHATPDSTLYELEVCVGDTGIDVRGPFDRTNVMHVRPEPEQPCPISAHDSKGSTVAFLQYDSNETGDWIILCTNANNWHARTDVLPYSAETWSALEHCLKQLQEALNRQ